MRFQFLFKLPKYKRFNFEPRHYDPAKEEMEERKARIRFELERERRTGSSTDENGSLQRGFMRRQERPSVSNSVGITRLFLILVMTGLTFGWLEWGNVVFYPLAVIVGLYIFLRVRSK